MTSTNHDRDEYVIQMANITVRTTKIQDSQRPQETV